MNKFVESTPEETPILWENIKVNRGLYIRECSKHINRDAISIFASNGKGDVVIFYQSALMGDKSRQFRVASDETWAGEFFIRLHGTLTCEIVS